MTGIKRELLAVADGAKPIGRNTQRHEIRARGGRAPLAQRQIVLGSAALVAMTFDAHGPAAVSLEERCGLVEGALPLAGQVAAIQFEKNRLQRGVAVQIV